VAAKNGQRNGRIFEGKAAHAMSLTLIISIAGTVAFFIVGIWLTSAVSKWAKNLDTLIELKKDVPPLGRESRTRAFMRRRNDAWSDPTPYGAPCGHQGER
jgi:hypothetical protein